MENCFLTLVVDDDIAGSVATAAVAPTGAIISVAVTVAAANGAVSVAISDSSVGAISVAITEPLCG